MEYVLPVVGPQVSTRRPGPCHTGLPKPGGHQRKRAINGLPLGCGDPPTSAIGRNLMTIATLLTTAIVSLATVGGGLAAYIAVTKYETMNRISVAEKRLEIVRAVGDIPAHMNPERGFATNILFGANDINP